MPTPPIPPEMVEEARERREATQEPPPRTKESLQAEYADNYVAREAAVAAGDTDAAEQYQANLDVLAAAISAA